MFTAQALQKDADQELRIDADTQSADIKNGTLTFIGDVRVQQGSLLLNADQLNIHRGEGEGREILIATGEPARYQQELEDGQVLKAEAYTIEYDLTSKTLTLTTKAMISQAGSLVKGEVIKYNIETEQLLAESQDQERVTTILIPKSKDDGEQQ